jgi:hypothetical protein
MDPQMPGNSSRAKPAAVIFAVLFVLTLIFGLWTFSKEQDYKKNSDAKSAVAAATAKKQQQVEDQAKYDAANKQPYKTFTGPTVYGTVSFNYPKNWSVYLDQTNQNEPVNAYFYPDIVPAINSSAAYPLRLEISSSDYAQIVSQYTQTVTAGSLKSSAYVPPKLTGTANVQPGVKLDGLFGQQGNSSGQQGSMVIIKVRDKTMQIYTQSPDGLTDFNSVVLPSLTFIP